MLCDTLLNKNTSKSKDSLIPIYRFRSHFFSFTWSQPSSKRLFIVLFEYSFKGYLRYTARFAHIQRIYTSPANIHQLIFMLRMLGMSKGNVWTRKKKIRTSMVSVVLYVHWTWTFPWCVIFNKLTNQQNSLFESLFDWTELTIALLKW